MPTEKYTFTLPKLDFMTHKIVYLIITLAFLSCKSNVEEAADTIDTKKMGVDISVLASDSLLGRSPFGIAEELTVSYLSKRMIEIGLEPAFDTSFYQNVSLVELITYIPEKLNISTLNEKLSLEVGYDFTVWSHVLESEVKIENSNLVFAGFGISAKEWSWNDFEGVDIKGKTIVVLVNDPGFVTGDSTLFKGKTMTYYGRWRYKFEEAERQGALGCIIVHEDEAAGYPWAIVNGRTNRSDFFLDNGELNNRNCKIQGWITRSSAEKLFEECGMSYENMKHLASQHGFKPVEMNASYSITLSNTWKKSTSRNVAGFIKGNKYPEEAIVYSAHWDHLGIGKAINGDSIYNGASDNAAAMAWMLAIAKAFKATGHEPERSVVFFAPTAEEAGMLGSEFYVANSPFPIQKTVACFNNDVILMIGKFKDVTVTGLGHSNLDSLLNIEALLQGRYICNDPNPENGMFFRSDQMPFLLAGVPSLFAKGYSHQVELGKEKTIEFIGDYWKNTYHKPSDHFNPEVHNLDGLAEDAELFFKLGNNLANSRMKPKWNSESEFFVE